MAAVFATPIAYAVGLSRGHFGELFAAQPVGRWVVNSLFVTSTQTLLSVGVSSLGGFALAKYRFRGRAFFTAALAATVLMPGVVLLPSLYELIVRLGWTDSYLALIVPACGGGFGTLLFRNAMRAVPDELLDAARIDGMGELRIWYEIALPLVRPMTAAQTLLAFTAAWNGYLWPAVVLQSEGKFTVPVALANLAVLPSAQADAGGLMAATLVGVLPVVVVFTVLQREFVAGLAEGSDRG